MAAIDLNSDIGEGFGPYSFGHDEEIAGFVTSASLACGFHASDPMTMWRTVLLCKAKGVMVGAHPGYPDRVGFGRRRLAISPEELEADMIYQIGALLGFCLANGVPMQHVKPHGALYNAAAEDRQLAAAIARAVRSVDKRLMLLAPYGSALALEGERAGLRVAYEAFADRAYGTNGQLVPRSQGGVLPPDSAARQALDIVLRGRVRTVAGGWVAMRADTICVHGDSPEAPQAVRAIWEALTGAGVSLRPLSSKDR